MGELKNLRYDLVKGGGNDVEISRGMLKLDSKFTNLSRISIYEKKKG